MALEFGKDVNCMDIYRSIECTRPGGYPLKMVEIMGVEGNYAMDVYDVGFDPPYWDLMRLAQRMDTFESAARHLWETMGIKVAEWHMADEPFFKVSNALVRDELRYGLNEDEKFSNLLDSKLDAKTYDEAFAHMFECRRREYAGLVYARVMFLTPPRKVRFFGSDLEFPSSLLSCENIGYIVGGKETDSARNEELVGQKRIIIKSSHIGIAFGCSCRPGEEPRCSVYDQGSRTFMHEGHAAKITINFPNLGETFILTSGELNHSTGKKKWLINSS